MKKLLLFLLILLITPPILASCGDQPADPPVSDTVSDTNDAPDGGIAGPSFPEELSYDYDLSGYISLPEHHGLVLHVKLLTVSDGDVDAVIENELAAAGTSVEVRDRPADYGDTVTYDVTGTRRDTGGEIDRGTGRTAVIGSGAYLEGFADHLIGAAVGDVVEFEYVYPADHYDPSLAGITADFKVTVTDIRLVTPAELTDAFAASLGIEGVSDVTSYRDHIRAVMQDNADAENEQTLRDAVYEILDGGSTVLKWPEREWEYYKGICDKTADTYASISGITREAYILQTYGSAEAYGAYVEEYCEKYVKRDLIAFSISREYGVSVDRAEYERELRYGYEKYGASYGAESISEFEKMFSFDLTSGLLLASALNAVAAEAVVG